jgi:hypothetical protein
MNDYATFNEETQQYEPQQKPQETENSTKIIDFGMIGIVGLAWLFNVIALAVNVCFTGNGHSFSCRFAPWILSILAVLLISFLGLFSVATLLVEMNENIDMIGKFAAGFLIWIFSVAAWGKTQNDIDGWNKLGGSTVISLGASMVLMVLVWLLFSAYMAAAAYKYYISNKAQIQV